MGKNVVDTGVGGGKYAGIPYVFKGCGTSHSTIQFGDVGPYAHYCPYHQRIPPQGGPSDDISK